MSGLNLLVFREARRCVHSRDLKSALVQQLKPANSSKPDWILTALLRAGELECAIADSGHPPDLYQGVTDRLADVLVSSKNAFDGAPLEGMIAAAPSPETVSVAPAEGFAYYALHPLSYARVLDQIPLSPPVAVVGIRSIGTTLSAVTAAEARRRGVAAARLTVRPHGHPYHRQTRFAVEQLAFIEKSLAKDALFLVVDEGPGLSGSSFLSVAEALEQVGVSRNQIVLVCAHLPQLDTLCSENAPARARRFCWQAVDTAAYKPEQAQIWVGAGEWRKHVFANQEQWPASWTSFERAKYLSSEKPGWQKLFKFAGLGQYRESLFDREEKAAQAGFGVSPRTVQHGFLEYPWLNARPMSANDLSSAVLLRLAQYCAFRARAFPAEIDNMASLQAMAEHNLHELKLDLQPELTLKRPVLCDGHMQPHEWLLSRDSQMIKTDSGSHGDDHFFPGPADIAWDLAGAIIEWGMDRHQSDFFLENYRRASGDEPTHRISSYLIAYTVFRCTWCMMAANAMRGTEEQSRLERAAADYRLRLQALEDARGLSPSQTGLIAKTA